jgi:tRNA dimethylallyltransferase
MTTARRQRPRHLVIVGPTAVGKSALALAVAELVDGCEIVTLDSMQVYRGLDIGTAKPSPQERAAVPHHLVDVADLSEEWSVARTQDAVRAVLAGLEARGRRAVLVGGTGLYYQAVVDGLALPGRYPAVRAALEHEADAPGGLARLHAELAGADPRAAARMEPTNRRRIVRALEVVRATGRPFSSFGPGLDAYGPPVLDVRIVGLDLDRATLGARVDERLRRMVALGFVDEARGLADRPRSRTVSQALGYRELWSEASAELALERTRVRTRQFARRQQSWFRRDPRIAWLDAGPDARRWARQLATGWSRAA